MESHLPISIRLGNKGLGDVRLALPGGASEMPPTLPSSLVAHDATPRGGGKLRKDGRVKPAVCVLNAGHVGRFILRRGTLASILARLSPDECQLIPVQVVDAEGPLDEDWALLEVRAEFPMDRDASEATYADPANKHGSMCERATRLAWGEGRAPRYTIFNLGEHPDVCMVQRDLAVALEKATRGALGIVAPPYPSQWPTDFLHPYQPPLGMHAFFGAHATASPAQAPAEAASSAAAFWSLYAGQGGDGVRARACRSPHYAYWLAKEIDRRPSDDTRAGTLTHPGYAYLYASQIDAAPRDDTRAAAARFPATSVAYAEHVDRGAHPVTRAGADAPDWKDTYERVCAQLGGNTEPAPAPIPVERPVPPREWPAVVGPRFVETAGAGGEGPTHAPLDREVRLDIDEFIGRGLALIGLDDKARPDEVVSAVHDLVGAVQRKQRKLARRKREHLALGCVFGEQIHRALGWTWASVRDGEAGGVALVSSDLSVALYPFALIERSIAPRSTENAVALTFNMLVDGAFPPGARAGAYSAIL